MSIQALISVARRGSRRHLVGRIISPMNIGDASLFQVVQAMQLPAQVAYASSRGEPPEPVKPHNKGTIGHAKDRTIDSVKKGVNKTKEILDREDPIEWAKEKEKTHLPAYKEGLKMQGQRGLEKGKETTEQMKESAMAYTDQAKEKLVEFREGKGAELASKAKEKGAAAAGYVKEKAKVAGVKLTEKAKEKLEVPPDGSLAQAVAQKTKDTIIAASSTLASKAKETAQTAKAKLDAEVEKAKKDAEVDRKARERREALGLHDEPPQKAGEVGHKVKAKAGDVYEGVKDKAGHLKDQTGHLKDQAVEKGAEKAEQLKEQTLEKGAAAEEKMQRKAEDTRKTLG